MGMDDQKHEDVGRPQGRGPAWSRWFRPPLLVKALAGLASAGVVVAALFFSGCRPEPGANKTAPALFATWPSEAGQVRRPDLVLVLSGQQHGYLQPCGCSQPQYGGLARRYNFVKGLEQRGWDVALADLGDVAQESGPQAMLKYVYSMKALKLMGYTAVGIGANEMRMPLSQCLGEYALNNKEPRVVVANLNAADEKFPDETSPCAFFPAEKPREFPKLHGQVPKVCFIGAVGPSAADPKQVRDPDVTFEANSKAIPRILEGESFKKESPELLVLLYQGTLKEARAFAHHFPQFHVILCLTEEEEPPGKPEHEGNTLLIEVGHKGRYIGAVGVYRTGQEDRPFDFYYQLVQLGPELDTPKGQEAANPVMGLMEEYAQDVHRGNYLDRFPRTRHSVQLAFPKATYIGTEECKKCHNKAYDIWKDTRHAHAYQTLVKDTRPSLRQYDGECVTCHVTGFDYQGGFVNEKLTPHLLNNGCENCHGPGSAHKDDPDNEEIRRLMNPFKTPKNETEEAKKVRLNRLDQSCQHCHNIDNDVKWSKVSIEEKWKQIAHSKGKR